MSKMKLSDTILEDLNKRILTGEFRNGQKLPTERELAAYYNTSRIPVRAALKQLAEDGVVKTAPSSGTTVISSGNTLAIPSKALSGWENSAVFYETISLRTLIEAEAAKYAAAARTAEDIKNIQNTLFESINEIRKLKSNENNSFFEADAGFHKSIALASHDPFFIKCMDAMPSTMASHQYWSLKFTNPRDEFISYHTRIYESILDGDGQKAYDAMLGHLSRVGSLITNKSECPAEAYDE